MYKKIVTYILSLYKCMYASPENVSTYSSTSVYVEEKCGEKNETITLNFSTYSSTSVYVKKN